MIMPKYKMNFQIYKEANGSKSQIKKMEKL